MAILGVIANLRYSHNRPALNFGALTLVCYVVIYPISGIVHTLRAFGTSGGYYQISTIDPGQSWSAVLLTALGLAFLCTGLLTGKNGATSTPSHKIAATWKIEQHADIPKGIMAYAVALMILSLPSLIKIRAYTASLDTNRVTSLTGGMARVGFLAQWCAWGIVILGLTIVVKARSRYPRLMVPTLIVTAVGTASSLSWTGGRAIVMIFLIPLMVAVWPSLSSTRRVWIVGAGLIASIASSIALTAHRAGGNNALGDVFDWQVGRFSMIGFAITTAGKIGYLNGETIAAGFLQLPNGIFQLLALPQVGTNERTVTEITGTYLLNDPEQRYIVPGMTSELFMNFGYLGVALGYFALGVAIRNLDLRLTNVGRTSTHRFALAYLGTLLLFCTMSSQSGALFNYAFFVGLPVVLMLFTRRWQREPRRSTSESLPAGSVGRSD